MCSWISNSFMMEESRQDWIGLVVGQSKGYSMWWQNSEAAHHTGFWGGGRGWRTVHNLRDIKWWWWHSDYKCGQVIQLLSRRVRCYKTHNDLWLVSETPGLCLSLSPASSLEEGVVYCHNFSNWTMFKMQDQLQEGRVWWKERRGHEKRWEKSDEENMSATVS